MLIIKFVIWEQICMDAGWEIFVNLWMSHVHKSVITQCHLNVMKIVRYVTWDFMEPVGMEIIANQMIHLALMLAVLQCHLYVMPTVLYVTMEVICMDAGWEISVNPMIYLVPMYVLL